MEPNVCILLCCVLLTVQTGAGQEQSGQTAMPTDDIRNELLQLRHELDSLKSARLDDQQAGDDAREQLEASLEKRLHYLESKIDAVSRATAPIALNPRMTAFINFAGRADSKTVYDLADPTKEISNRPFLRTVELELRNPVDPYAEAVTVISVENQAGKEFSIDAEEAYGLITRLPILESAPLGLKLKIGKYRAPFGVSNKIHMHDLPWTTRPLIVARYLGTEHGDFFESGFNPTGIDLNFYLPNPIPQSTLEMNADVVRAGEVGLSGGQSGTQPGYIGHLNFSRDWQNEHLLVLGASTYQENGSVSTRLYGVDLTYRWAPIEERESHSFVAGGEAMAGRKSHPDSTGNTVRVSPWGWFAYAQYQTSYWLYFGLRYDWLKEPVVSEPVTRSLAAYISYYTTEFLRFRVGIEHRRSELASQDQITTGLVEVNFVFGSHPTEPYWVNK